ncbi:MAG: DUF1501 domain-containing protein [Verrucomicrobiota bacterium]
MNFHLPLSRRQLLARTGMGFGSLALGNLLGNSGVLANDAPPAVFQSLDARQPHFPVKAKHVIHIFANGGASQVDTFDPKPLLTEYHGKPLPTSLKTERPTGAALGSPFAFKKYGQCGLEVSEIFANVGECADDLCVIRSMHADVPNHEPSLLLLNCGDARQIRPSMGSWLTYGLGTLNQNLPGFVVMCPGGYPIQESQNWQSGFLPGVFQGTYLDTKNSDVEKLIEHVKHSFGSAKAQRTQLDLLMQLNQEHEKARQQDAQLESRIQSFELAYRMQMEASDVFDLSKEPKHIRDMYGDGVQGRQMLYARRMIEKGVRFIQIWHGAGQPWDSHDEIEKNHRRLGKECDQPIAALIKDLKQRGLLDETLIIWSGEFGRTPTVELAKPGQNEGKVNGRDHNHFGFTTWLCGGGAKGGIVHGATDDFGFKAVKDPVHVHDLQATVLRLMGFDHERLTFRYAGRDFRLTDVHGKVVKNLIA